MPRTYRTIDSDGHVTEPPDLWQDYIEPAYKDRAPRFVSAGDGSESILVEDTVRLFPKGFAGATSFGKRPVGRYLEGRVLAEGSIRFYNMGDPKDLLAPADGLQPA